MAVAIRQSKHYYTESLRCPIGMTPCYICGRAVANQWSHIILVGMGGSHAVTLKEGESDIEGFLGGFPIGRSCWRKHPELHPYEVRVENEE